ERTRPEGLGWPPVHWRSMRRRAGAGSESVHTSASDRRNHPLVNDREYLVRRPCPPVVPGHDLDFAETFVAGALYPGAYQRSVDDAVPHHAAVEQQMRGRHQPVAEVERENPLATRTGNRLLQRRVPPHVID